MKKSRRTPVAIDTEGSVVFDLFEAAEAERLSIQSGLVLALEREIAARKWSQREAARHLGITQPRVNDLLRGRVDRFSIDSLIEYLARAGVTLHIETSRPKATRTARRRVA